MRRWFLLLGGLTLMAPAAVAAQGRADQARLMFTLGFGQLSGGGHLWSVGRQPVLIGPGVVDTIAVTRAFRRSLNVTFSGTYFPGNHLGFNFEGQLLGLGTADDCSIRFSFGDELTSDLCRTIGRSTHYASTVALSGGVIFRVASHQVLHPYVRANLGFVVSQASFLRTTGRVGTDSTETADLALYTDDDPASVQPYLSFGGGLVAIIGRGYQFRAEVRDNWVRLPAVSGPTPRQGVTPGSERVGRHFLTLLVGFDIVLERKHGRRY